LRPADRRGAAISRKRLVGIEAWAGGGIDVAAGRPVAARRGGPPPAAKLYVFGILLVDVTRADALCVLTLRREEKLNALSTALERELGDAGPRRGAFQRPRRRDRRGTCLLRRSGPHRAP
jgi:hypothetical protein